MAWPRILSRRESISRCTSESPIILSGLLDQPYDSPSTAILSSRYLISSRRVSQFFLANRQFYPTLGGQSLDDLVFLIDREFLCCDCVLGRPSDKVAPEIAKLAPITGSHDQISSVIQPYINKEIIGDIQAVDFKPLS